MAERGTVNAYVVGSSPTRPARNGIIKFMDNKRFTKNKGYKLSTWIEFPGSVYNDDVLYNESPLSLNKDREWHQLNNFSNFFDYVEPNEINNNFYRSENFTNVHNKQHTLFSGCSYTWGVGLRYDEVWSKIVYDKIDNASGYFNLGVPGNSIFQAIYDIFRYCKTYGNPDTIFFNIPSTYRFYGINDENNKIIASSYTPNENNKVLSLVAYQLYFSLEQYCLSNNIKLFSFTYTQLEDDDYPSKEFLNNNFINFKTFYLMDTKDLENFVSKYYKNSKNKDFLLIARDNGHLGIAYHEYWAEFIYNKYLESL